MKWTSQLTDAARRLQSGFGLQPLLRQPLPGMPYPGRRKAERPAAASEAGALSRVRFERGNPARLGLLTYVSKQPRARPPLVMLLHGCRQDPAAFARDSGWVDRIERAGGVLVVPEQRTENNHSQCFNWFDVTAEVGRAELQSLTRALQGVGNKYGCDSARTCVVGLSAGGAMAAALLAASPDRIAAGAVVAGLPVGAARSAGEALHRMVAPTSEGSDADWAARARALAPAGYEGPWPRVSVWHGTADQVVSDGNATLLVRQWRGLHGLADTTTSDVSPQDRVRHRVWQGTGRHGTGRPVLEQWTLAGIDHAYPVGPDASGGRWVSPTMIDATTRIADFFGLDER